MQLKWLADLLAVADSASFKAAAELRHVTAPAFGRRLRALEQWAGVALFDSGGKADRLTPAGRRLLEQGRATAHELEQLREQLRSATDLAVVRIATGRALARGFVADALAPLLRSKEAVPQIHVVTRLMSEASELLERDEVDVLLSYHHPALALRLDGRRYLQARAAPDRLVPVVRAQAAQAGGYKLLAYDPAQALGRLVDDHLAHLSGAPDLPLALRCDSVEALHEYALRGMGVAWLPLSMVAADLSAGLLAYWGDPAWQIPFESRLFRRKKPKSAAVLRVWEALVAQGRQG